MPEKRQHDQAERRGRHQRAAHVVGQLPAVDARERPAHQERQQLPVASHPAVQARGGDVGVRGFVLDQGDVAHHRAARDGAFEQIVAEHLFGRQPPDQHGLHGVHMEQAFAGEAAFAEQVLVDVRRHRAVGVEPPLAVVQPLVRRRYALVAQGRHHAWLQDAVAVHHPLATGVEHGPVLRVLRHTHQCAQPARRQLRVAVEREDVSGVRSHARDLAQVEERAGGAGGQRHHQLLDLAALAFPAQPAAFGCARAALAVQQQEPGRFACVGGISRIQCLHQAFRLAQQGRVVGTLRCVGVDPVAEQRELRKGFGVGQVVQVQPMHECGNGGRTGEQRGDHHQRACRLGQAIGHEKSGQVHGLGRLADQAVDQRDHRLRCREQHEHQGQACGGLVDPTHGRIAPAQQQPHHEPQRAGQQGAEIQRRSRQAKADLPAWWEQAPHTELVLKFNAPFPFEPEARQRRGTGAVCHGLQQGLCYLRFEMRAERRQALDAMQRGVARGLVLGREDGRRQHHPHDPAGVSDDLGPVGRADQSQRGHRVAHAQVIGRLVGVDLGLQRRQIGRNLSQPVAHLWQGRTWTRGTWACQALRKMHQEDAAHTALFGERKQGLQLLQRDLVDAPCTLCGEFARSLLARNAIDQSAQVLHQHHAQGGGQRPQLALTEFAGLLVGVEKMLQQGFNQTRHRCARQMPTQCRRCAAGLPGAHPARPAMSGNSAQATLPGFRATGLRSDENCRRAIPQRD
jgi:hypothetical protein